VERAGDREAREHSAKTWFELNRRRDVGYGRVEGRGVSSVTAPVENGKGGTVDGDRVAA